MHAVMNGQIESCRALIQKGAKTETKTTGGWSALTLAASYTNDQCEVAIALIELGANPDELKIEGGPGTIAMEPETRTKLKAAIEKKLEMSESQQKPELTGS